MSQFLSRVKFQILLDEVPETDTSVMLKFLVGMTHLGNYVLIQMEFWLFYQMIVFRNYTNNPLYEKIYVLSDSFLTCLLKILL